MKSTRNIDGSSARRGLVAIAVALGLSGCVAVPRESFSPAEAAGASPPGFSDVRFDDGSSELIDRLRQEVRPNAANETNVLALSGGGANGAYGAGVVYGW